MNIPDLLETQIREGRVVLCLGAGASLNSRDAKRNHPPTGKQLALAIAQKFLGGKYADAPLHQVAEYAISESDLGQVQGFIRDIFEPFKPTSAHLAMTKFNWHGLATTNYDTLIEKAYEEEGAAVQGIRTLIENGDKVEHNLRESSDILLLKLHGCITRVTNERCPLILTIDQYLEHRDCRSRLFDHLTGWSYEHPIVFIGHSLEDADIRSVLLEVLKIGALRPRNFIVAPDVDEIKSRFWESKKISPLKGTFDDFIAEIERRIPSHVRRLAVLEQKSSEHPISKKFRVHGAVLSRSTAQFLEVDVEYVNEAAPTEYLAPSNFYKGISKGFSAIEQGLDLRRKLADTILSDHVLGDEEANPSEFLEIILAKAHAGAGKTVMLRRMAWDAAKEYEKLVLFLKPNGVINRAALQELIGYCRQRIFLFVDDAGERIRELRGLIKQIGPEGKFLTIILAERINEWNVFGESVAPHVTAEHELKYLTSTEANTLIELLEKHKALGRLEPLTPDQRKSAFVERAGRQLLVALHEATLGKPFEQIILDEFNNIVPREAQNIYLTICVLNRLNVPVRAGVIARIHGITFDEFKTRLFAPLEHVVLAEYDSLLRDYQYRARHPYIAEMVFRQVLSHPEDRYDAYVKCLSALNVDYSADQVAFRQMIRGRNVLELFPDYQMAKSIFQIATDVLGEDGHLMHQMAIYEMHRPDGSLSESARLLRRAAELLPDDPTVQHSMAENRLKAADKTKSELEREKMLEEAAVISSSLAAAERTSSHPHHTLLKIGLKRVREAIDAKEADAVVEKLIKEVESTLYVAQQRFPGDSHILEAEAQLAHLLSDSERVLGSLKKAFAANPRSTFVASRLSRAYESQGDWKSAKKVIESALDANRADRRLHFMYAKLLLASGDATGQEIAYHLVRSFTEGDSNLDAQVLYGRQLYINGDLEGSSKTFRRLKDFRVSPQVRNRLLYPLPERFTGKVAKIEMGYCWIVRDGNADWVYLHVSNVDDEIWKELTTGTQMSFQIAFTVRGVNAFNVRIVGHAHEPRERQAKLFKAPVG